MLSKGKVKYIHSLEMKKYRNELNAFVAEGNKLVADMMFAFECELVLAKPSWMAMQGNIPAKELLEAEDAEEMRELLFRALSSLETFADLLELMNPEAKVEGVVMHTLARELQRIGRLVFKIQDAYSTVELVEA